MDLMKTFIFVTWIHKSGLKSQLPAFYNNILLLYILYASMTIIFWGVYFVEMASCCLTVWLWILKFAIKCSFVINNVKHDMPGQKVTCL